MRELSPIVLALPIVPLLSIPRLSIVFFVDVTPCVCQRFVERVDDDGPPSSHFFHTSSAIDGNVVRDTNTINTDCL